MRFLLGLALVACAKPTALQPASPELRLYVLDCGTAWLADGAPASDTGEFDGVPLELADPCFLVRHPRGWLLWDTGLAPDQAGAPGFRVAPGPPLAGQLAAIGLTPADISLLAFSHLHFDHTGNAALFTRARWLVSEAELRWAEHEPPHLNVDPARLVSRRTAEVQRLTGDHDVFGDGTVRILRAPGHTPGSAVLWLQLRDHEPVILSGDLFVTHDAPRAHIVPRGNADRAATLASIDRITRLARDTGAQIIVQHDPAARAALPRFPGFLH